MIDATTETLLSLTDAAKALPGRPNITTVWRWRSRGVRGVKLETVLCGGRRFTSLEALARFHERVTAAADGEPVASRSNRQREAQQRAARQELMKEGMIDGPNEKARRSS